MPPDPPNLDNVAVVGCMHQDLFAPEFKILGANLLLSEDVKVNPREVEALLLLLLLLLS